MELIKQLAALVGLQDNYVHAQGHTEVISLDKQQAILQAMGYDLTSNDALQEKIVELSEQPWLEVIAPVTVCQQGEPLRIRVQQLQQNAVSDWQWQINTEEQQQLSSAKINAAYAKMGNVFQDKLGDWSSAIYWYEKSLSKEADTALLANVYFNLSFCYAQLKNNDQSSFYKKKLIFKV